jgi:molecular chaperone GrpE
VNDERDAQSVKAEPAPDENEQEPAETQNAELTPAEIDDLKKRAREGEEYLDLLKRTKADFANFQKRVSEDRKQWAVLAKRELLASILSAADQSRVAAERSGEDDSVESLRGALNMIWSELERFLEAAGVTAIPASGAEFDPAVHQALHVDERTDVPDATVVQEIIRGYQFAGQLLRPAQVVVAKRPKPPHEAEEPEAGEENPLDRAETMEEDGARDTPLDAGGEGDTDGAEYR